MTGHQDSVLIGHQDSVLIGRILGTSLFVCFCKIIVNVNVLQITETGLLQRLSLCIIVLIHFIKHIYAQIVRN